MMHTNIFNNNNSMIIKSLENQIKYKFEHEIRTLSKRLWPKPSTDSFRNLLYQRKMVLNTMCFELNSLDEENNFEIVNNKLVSIYENIFDRIAKFSNYLLIDCKNNFFVNEYQIAVNLQMVSARDNLSLNADNAYGSDFNYMNKLINLYYSYSPYESLRIINIILRFRHSNMKLNDINAELEKQNKLKRKYEASDITLLKNTKFKKYKISELMKKLVCNSCMSIPDIVRINDFLSCVEVKCICSEEENGDLHKSSIQKVAANKFIVL